MGAVHTRRHPLALALASSMVASQALAASSATAVAAPEAREGNEQSADAQAREAARSAINRSSSAQTPTQTPNWKAVQGGLILFTVGYGLALTAAASSSFEGEAKWLAAPVAGPWIALGSGAETNGWILAGDGIIQFVGALIAVGGFLYPKRAMGPPRRAQQHAAVKEGRRSSVVVVPIAVTGPKGALTWGVRVSL
jgi:hypothetical protein